MHHDNLVDVILNLMGEEAQALELLSITLSACDSVDLRSKFVLTLDGLKRLLQTLASFEITSEEDVESGKELINSIAICVLDSAENCAVFQREKGYELMLDTLHNKYLRSDALKVLSFCGTRSIDAEKII